MITEDYIAEIEGELVTNDDHINDESILKRIKTIFTKIQKAQQEKDASIAQSLHSFDSAGNTDYGDGVDWASRRIEGKILKQYDPIVDEIPFKLNPIKFS